MESWKLDYSDGSANMYRFWQEEGGQARFEYDPVRPEESSTGFYSGGDPCEGVLERPFVEELWARVEALEAMAEPPDYQREKGSGAFYIGTREGHRAFCVARMPLLLEFDDFLKQLRAVEGRES